jgi:alpha-galactosidase
MTNPETTDTTPFQAAPIYHLRAAGTSLVLDARGAQAPIIVHWGEDLGDLPTDELRILADAMPPGIPPSSIDVPLRVSLLPSPAEGWSGRPAATGFRVGEPAATRGNGTLDLRLVSVDSDRANTVTIVTTDAAASVSITTEIELSVEGVLRVRHTLDNAGDSAFELGSLDAVLPVPERAQEILDFTGLWTHERRPQRTPFGLGQWNRETRHGRPGHDDPYLTAVGTPGFGFRTGEVWATHLAWSGDKRVWAEGSALGYRVVGSGELLAPGEVSVAPGSSYTSPWTVAVYSNAGLDGLSARLHPWIRSWSTIPGPRPVILNTWEAVYFDHNLETLERLVARAAEVGVERFVLDDGWFTGRTDDHRALGDWFVDAEKWPEGLHPLVERVHAAGMEFGLWVEPEMVNLDSDLAREHPDWVLGDPGSLTWRFQHVLDLSNPDAFDYILTRLRALLAEYPIAYLKWDHNRDLLGGSAHRQTNALYRLIDTVRAEHPGLEIESCASGGARIDLGILERTDRVWTSDTNDPLERQQIQRYTGVLVPPEYLGGHLGAATSHTTGRTSDLSFRLATALFGSAGIEWDLTKAGDDELPAIAAWISEYKSLRGLLHSGTVVRPDPSDPALQLHGVVAADRSAAVFCHAALAAPRGALPAPLRFPGLEPLTTYRVKPLELGKPPRVIQDAPAAWLAQGEALLSGASLERVGLPAPLLAPEQAAVYLLEAVPAD